VVSPTHKRAEGRAPVWGSEFTTKAVHYREDSVEIDAELKRNSVLLIDCVERGGAALPSRTAESNLENPSGKMLSLAASLRARLRTFRWTSAVTRRPTPRFYAPGAGRPAPSLRGLTCQSAA
jgi:hypothetical protein